MRRQTDPVRGPAVSLRRLSTRTLLASVNDAVSLQPEELDRQKRERLRRLASFEIPLLRVIGSLLIAFGVWVNNRFLLGIDAFAPWLATASVLAVYCAVSWTCLAIAYRERAPKHDLSLLFLVLDLPIWTIAIYFSGAERSWLFFILFMRVADQAQTTFRRCVFFATFGTLCYAAMLAWVRIVDGRQIFETVAVAKVIFIAFGGLYIALTARTAEARRGQMAGAMRISRDLVRQLAERTAELREARQRAEEASEAKSEFLANMSHEMRTPLHGILGMLQLAIEGETSPARARRLDMARRSAESLLTTIDDLLDFAKIEARKLELEPVYFSLRELITETLKALGVTAAEKGLALSFEIGRNVPDRLWGDPLRLRQILVNLVGNAIKFTERGEVVVRVRPAVLSSHLAVEVRDTGIGIDPALRTTIFEPFAQADTSHARRFGGTGLGLAIVARLVDAMGGVITVDAAPGGGSVFRFTISLSADALAVDPRPEWEAQLATLRALVIEPHATSREIIGGILQDRGMTAELFATAHEVTAAATEADVVVADADATAAFALPLVRIASPLETFDDDVVTVTRPVAERELLDAVGVALGFAEAPATFTLEPVVASQRKLDVLLADDHPVNQEFAADTLRRLGHTVTLASDGLRALELLQQQKFDLVLMDVQMPGLDGLEVTRRFRAYERAHNGEDPTPIYALTAHSRREDRDRCVEAGMNGFLTKPVTPAKLAALLHVPEEEAESQSRAILDAVGGNMRLLARVREAMAEQNPRLLAAIREAIAANDGPGISRSAHTLKGAVSNFGIALDPARELEEAGHAGNIRRAAELLPRLEAELRELESRLAALV